MADSPLVDIPVGNPDSGLWNQGMTIKDILEKVDLFNISAVSDDDMKNKDIKPILNEDKKVINMSKPTSAFLGPKIWKNPITLPMLNSCSDNAEFSIMNIDDFLNENNLDLDRISPPLPDDDFIGLANKEAANKQLNKTRMMDEDSMDSMDCGKKNMLPKGDNSFLYAESKRAKIERERAERKRKMEVDIEFGVEELALATIPGADFDPKRHHFSADELRPQPIIRKRKKTFVLTNEKDDKYWQRRSKNNMAARRSREARRLKENQIALRTAFLEKENAALRAALDKSAEENEKLTSDNKRLQQTLKSYEEFEI